MDARPLNQPDFAAAAGGLRLMADNLELCPNLPAIDGGDRIFRMLARLDEKLDALHCKFDALHCKVDASDRNHTSRLTNSVVVSGGMALSPLYCLETGQEISGCPSTLADLEAFSDEQAASLLRELNENVPKGLEQKIRKLKLAFGIRTQFV